MALILILISIRILMRILILTLPTLLLLVLLLLLILHLLHLLIPLTLLLRISQSGGNEKTNISLPYDPLDKLRWQAEIISSARGYPD